MWQHLFWLFGHPEVYIITLMHTGFLGAFLTFSSAPWYPGESRDLADQQLAGLIMWVMGGIPYIIGAVWAAQRWYRRLQQAEGEGKLPEDAPEHSIEATQD